MTFTCQNATCRCSRRGSGTVRHKMAKTPSAFLLQQILALAKSVADRQHRGNSAREYKKKNVKPQKLFRSSEYLSNQIAGSAFGLVSIHSAVTEVKELSSELSGFPRIVCTADLYIYSFILIVFSCLRKNLRWGKQPNMYQRSYLLQLLF